MTLLPGTKLGLYEIVAPLGAGGMGEVYRARDTRLAREVAIKVLPTAFTSDPERLMRFEREAQLLAAVSHPNIAAVYGFDESDGIHYLVQELVSGETLAERLKAGPLDVENALQIGGQIAAALEAAHDRGIIHRDLKPANVKITLDGNAKVLDFGLAKLLAPDSSGAGRTSSPTITSDETREGVILGTAAYMSPEQARGKPVDKRTDVWAFGCVVYEMLTGQSPFGDATVSDTIVKILEREPDWNALPGKTPTTVRRLLRRCLQRDLSRRLKDIGDARLELDEALAGSAATAIGELTLRPSAPTLRSRWLPVVALVGVVVGALASWFLKPSEERARPPIRFSMALPSAQRLAGLDFPAVAMSPAGTHVAYIATRGGGSQLYLRAMDALEPTPVAGTSQALSPFFSPDGEWVAFFAGGQLKKVSIHGGAPVIICEAPIGFGGSWGDDDTIVFAPTSGSGLSQVEAAGGTPRSLTRLNAQRGEFSHRWPELLPDRDTVLFTIGTVGSWDDAEIVAESRKTGKREVLIQGGSHPHYASTGHLMYARAGTVMAVKFDPSRLEVTGRPFPVQDRVIHSFDGAAQFAFSRDGTLVYAPGNLRGTDRTLVWVDRQGIAQPLPAIPAAYAGPRLSPDGRSLAASIERATEDIWTYDISANAATQLTFEAANSGPVWTPDGKSITFTSTRAGPPNLFSKRADGSTGEERLSASERPQTAFSWSSDGRALAFVEYNASTGRDIWVLSTDGDRKPRPFLRSPANETGPAFSPDGRWLAYISDESGRNEVYLRPFSESGGKWRISTDGGAEPVWSRTGQELYYRAGDQMMAVKVTLQPGFSAAKPVPLFQGAFEKGNAGRPNYDVAPDGMRFLMLRPNSEEAASQFTVVLEWFQELQKRAAAAQ